MANIHNADLKSCPFCGGEAFLAYRLGTSYDVQCKNIACAARVNFKDRTEKSKATVAWNLRHTPEAIPVKHERHAVGDYRCPNCDAAFIIEAGITPYCGNCGQRLDWSNAPA